MKRLKHWFSCLPFETWGRHWKRIPRAVRRPLVLVIGTAIIVLGLILVPLPGPGWAIVFLGLAVLATEFVIAQRMRDWLVRQLKKWAIRSEKLIKKRLKHKQ